MEYVTRTAYLSALQSAMVRGAIYHWLPYTTLNEKFNVQSGVYPPAGTNPIMSYLALGRGGLKMSVGADGEPYPDVRQHKSTDAALFDFMPFSLRLLDDDLPAERRNRYAMRVQKEYGGMQYWAYYLKRVDFSQADTTLYLKHKLPDGTVTTEPFVPDESNLNPTPVDLSESGTNLLAGTSVIASTLIQLGLDTFDISEIRKASQIIKQQTGRAFVSELALCTGAAKSIPAPSPTGSFPFNEAIGVQIASFIQTTVPLDFLNQDFTEQLELGISEPLFRVEGVNA